MKELENLKRELKSFLLYVDKQNFFKSYDGAMRIVESFRGKQLNKSEVVKALIELDDEWVMNVYQEEVFLEVAKCLEGYSSPNNNINWW